MSLDGDVSEPKFSGVVFRRDRRTPAWSLVLCIFLLAAFPALLIVLPQETEWFAVVAVLAIPGVVIGLIWGIVCVRHLQDHEPKLLLDGEGITDNRAVGGPRFISWEGIVSMDYEYHKETDVYLSIPLTKTWGRIIAYCLDPESHDVQAIRINILGLNARPSAVRDEIKRSWTRYNVHRRGG